ncbi:MAG: hypothetical protein M1820_007622 [Bogoriella megaspora]|nr:MAG: hypothetical protein M1820_007622 [Bogoriella megaspora]
MAPRSNSGDVYVQGEFSEPMTAQHNFAEQFDLDNPIQAMSSYSRIMHKHTQEQLEMATTSARRRSDSPSASLKHEDSGSSMDSVSSTSS